MTTETSEISTELKAELNAALSEGVWFFDNRVVKNYTLWGINPPSKVAERTDVMPITNAYTVELPLLMEYMSANKLRIPFVIHLTADSVTFQPVTVDRALRAEARGVVVGKAIEQKASTVKPNKARTPCHSKWRE